MFRRLLGIVLEPRRTFEALRERPTWLAALAFNLGAIAATKSLFLRSAVGMEVVRNRLLDTYESIRDQITGASFEQLVASHGLVPNEDGTSSPLWLVQPLQEGIASISSALVVGGLVFAIGTAAYGPGVATFRQILAVISHSWVILTIGSAFVTGCMYVSRSATVATSLGVFLPMVDETVSVYVVAAHIDVVGLWWAAVFGTGIAVVYRCRVWVTAACFVLLYLLQSVAHAALEIVLD